MATIHIPTTGGTNYTADLADTTYILDKDSSIISGAFLFQIDASNAVAGRSFVIDGQIYGPNSRGILLKASFGAPNTISIGSTGAITSGDSAIRAEGGDIAITNEGVLANVKVGVAAVSVVGDGYTIDNAGTISGHTGVEAIESGTIVNSGTIVTTGTAVRFEAGAIGGDVQRLVNTGTMVGLVQGINAGDVTIINKGSMTGSIYTSGGNDVFRNAGGHMNGSVNLGTGNDRYYLGSDPLRITDTGGQDKVYAAADLTLALSVEEGHLAGRKNIDLTGNYMDSALFGNSGDNRIVGMKGADTIDGGRGSDTLTGDDGLAADVGDTFVFKRSCGRDTITDFTDGFDLIDLGGYRRIDEFSDLKGHIRQAGDDVVVTLGHGDQITLHHANAGDIGEADFVF